MSDSDKPQTPPPEQPVEQAAGEKYPKLAKLLRKEGREQKRDKPVTGKPPGLDDRDLGYGFGAKEREWLALATLIGSIGLTLVLWAIGYLVMGGPH